MQKLPDVVNPVNGLHLMVSVEQTKTNWHADSGQNNGDWTASPAETQSVTYYAANANNLLCASRYCCGDTFNFHSMHFRNATSNAFIWVKLMPLTLA